MGAPIAAKAGCAIGPENELWYLYSRHIVSSCPPTRPGPWRRAPTPSCTKPPSVLAKLAAGLHLSKDGEQGDLGGASLEATIPPGARSRHGSAKGFSRPRQMSIPRWMAPLALPTGLKQLGAEPFLAALVRSSDCAIIGKTPDGHVLSWNAAAERLYGYRAEEMLGRDISILMPPDRPRELAYLLAQVAQGKVVTAFHTERLRKDGTIVGVTITVSPVVNAEGVVVGASTIAHDLSQYLDHVRILQESERRTAEALSTLETLQSSAPIGLGFVDREFRLVHLNEVLAAVNGSHVQDQIGKTVAEVVPEIWPRVEMLYRQVLERDEAILNVEVTGESATEPGRQHHWLVSFYPVHLGTEVIGVGIVVVDVTERLQADEFRSIAMNQMDEGLFATDDQGRMTYMNGAVTKMLGWTEADVRGRLIHDLIHTQREDGTPIHSPAECDHNKVRTEGRSVRGDDMLFTCKNGTTIPVAYSIAPISSGALGNGTVIVFRDISEEKAERLRLKRERDGLTWVGRIREALEEDRFVLYSQPIVPLTGGRPSEELLIRMVGREGEVIAPGAFLGAAEKFGVITEIDQWVVSQAARLAAEGRSVSVNLSAESIVNIDLLALIDREVAEAGADPSHLVFEITETALIRDVDKGEAFARGAVEHGYRLALDDFGTGFGTFTHVKKLPIKFLKIDIEFVRDLVTSLPNQHVVKAIVNLAQGFGCQTVAEGVEDGETLRLVQDLGVDFAQGYYLGRPAPL
jgi:PAS domain S-box-containing protein